MLIIFESTDKTGKTTLACRLSEEIGVPYIKLNNIQIEDNEKILNNVSISTHSQLETFVQLYEKGVIKDAIIDRFHASEFVYSRLFNRDYDTSYISEIDDRLSKFNDVILIRPGCFHGTLIDRWKEEKLLDTNVLQSVDNYYQSFYEQTVLPVINIDTEKDIEMVVEQLYGELYKRGIYKGHLRPRVETHEKVMMEIAMTIKKRGKCLNRQIGAVLTEDGYIVGVGYNGPPSGFPHCETCIRREINIPSGQAMNLSRALHAEENAIIQSGIRAKSDKDLRLYTTDSPCVGCMRQLIQIGVNTIYYIVKYPDALSWEMAEIAGIKMVKMEV